MKARVLVGVPSGDSLPLPFFTSFPQAVKMEDGGWRLYSVRGMNTVSARNKIVYKALNENYTHVFFMDSDMEFPQSALERLLHHNKDIVGGFYCRKKKGFLPNAFKLGIKEKNSLMTEYVDDFREVEAIGTGCLLIKTEVFKKIEKPWFEYRVTDAPDCHMSTEDIVFCDKAKEAGYKIYCDGTVNCGHVGTFVVKLEKNHLGQPWAKVEPV